MMVHTKYQGSRPCGFIREDFYMFLPIKAYVKPVTPEVHYGFPAHIHSDQGRNFESRVIRELCILAGVAKSRTTPYHPIGNGMVERFNQTLLKMLGTLEENQKHDWKSYVAPLVHSYNATRQDSTCYSPFFLMFGRHPRLAVDAYFGI